MGRHIPGRCKRCGKLKASDNVFYIVRVTLTAELDDNFEDLSGEALEQEMSKQLKIAETKDEQELIDEVYQDLHFYLYKSCRDWFVKRSLGGDMAQGAVNG